MLLIYLFDVTTVFKLFLYRKLYGGHGNHKEGGEDNTPYVSRRVV